MLGAIVRSGTPMRKVGFTLTDAPDEAVNVTPKSLLGDTGTPADMQKFAGEVKGGESVNVNVPPA